MYKLFIDSDKSFSCDVDIKGCDISECHARIILETDKFSILLNGEINEDGKCSVEIPKLNNLLKEDTKGKMILEIIAENALFLPWESDFIVEKQKDVKVSSVKEDKKKPIKENSVTVGVRVDEEIEPPKNLMKEHISMINSLIKENEIKTEKQFNKLFDSYLKSVISKNLFTESDIQKIKNYTKITK